MSFDYKKIGFKCGLEIHQQLETHKLFCSCPSIVNDKHPHVVAKRQLKAVVGETGEIDIAAAHEQDKSKTFIYEGCKDSYCLVELDEEPPHPINQEAIDIALQVAKMLHMDISDEIQVMRKIVIDGSNVGGFQRTALVAMNGYIETSQGKVPIPLLCIEEEAAKKVKTTEDSVTYRLDRLGVVLLEISTDASIKDPEHAKECASIIGMILRSTGKAKRGIGTIRQDVNVSIKGGERTEIKGFQDLKSIPKVIDNEIKRQQKMIADGEKIELTVRKAEPDMSTTYLRPIPGAARMYPETDILPITIDKKRLDAVVVPELLSDKKEKLVSQYNLDEGLVADIIKKGYDFDGLVKEFKKVEPKTIASILVQVPKELRRKEKLDVDVLSVDDFREVFGFINSGEVPKEAASDVLAKKIKREKINLEDYKGADDSDVEKFVTDLVKKKPGLNMGGYMGLVMKEFGGKVDGKKVSGLIAKLLK